MKHTFSVKDSQVTKGIAVFLLLIHHLFVNPADWKGYPLRFFAVSAEQMVKIAAASKVCVAIFLFLTAYGMTIKYKKTAGTNKDAVRIALTKYVSILFSFLFVFLLTHLAWYVLNNGTNLQIYGNGMQAVWTFAMDALGISFFLGTATLNGVWWYMSLLFCVLCLLPVMWKLQAYMGVLILPAACLLPAALGLNGYMLPYLPTLALGVCAADSSLIEKIGAVGGANKGIRVLKWCVYVLLFGSAFVLRGNGVFNISVTNGVLSLLCVLLVYEIIGRIPLISGVLQLFGKYSFGIFVTHSLFILYFFDGKLFSLKYGILIIAVLAVVSLTLAVILTKLEKLCGVERLKKTVIGRIERFFCLKTD